MHFIEVVYQLKRNKYAQCFGNENTRPPLPDEWAKRQWAMTATQKGQRMWCNYSTWANKPKPTEHRHNEDEAKKNFAVGRMWFGFFASLLANLRSGLCGAFLAFALLFVQFYSYCVWAIAKPVQQQGTINCTHSHSIKFVCLDLQFKSAAKQYQWPIWATGPLSPSVGAPFIFRAQINLLLRAMPMHHDSWHCDAHIKHTCVFGQTLAP